MQLKEKLLINLHPLQRAFGLEIWDDSGIMPGEPWEERIWKEFEKSQIIFILLTENFLASEFCLRKEFKKAIERHKKRQVNIIPIILKPCDWHSVKELKALQVLPPGGKAITGGAFRPQSRGYQIVTSEVRKLLVARARNGSEKNIRPRKLTSDNFHTTPYKAVFFDLDGTLIRGRAGYENFRYSWQLVWAHLGYHDSERKLYYQKYLDGEINYKEWCNITLDLFKGHKLHEKHFQEIAQKVKLTKHCRDALRILKQKGIVLCIISGGIDSFLKAVFPDYHEYFDYVFINKFHYDYDGIIDSIETTKYDFEGKFTAIEYIRKKHGIKYDECVFIGEGRNDVYAATELNRRGGLTIGYPPDHLRDLAKHEVAFDRLDALLDILFGTVTLSHQLSINSTIDTTI